MRRLSCLLSFLNASLLHGVQEMGSGSCEASSDASCGAAAARFAHPGIPPVSTERAAFLAEQGVMLQPIRPMGAEVRGLDLRKKPSEAVLQALQKEIANQGFVVFKDQGVLSGDELIFASKFWGGREIHSTHGSVHPKAPNRDIHRLSNDANEGFKGPGKQWHNDGSFTDGTFSHAGYNIVSAPEGQGDTQFVHQGAAFAALPAEKQERWQRLTSVNSKSGVMHPVVHEHYISGLKSVWLHLEMTGAVFEKLPSTEGQDEPKFRLLEEDELTELFTDYNDILEAGFENGYAISYHYEDGDCLFTDNLAVAHRASPGAHRSPKIEGLRILHRTTVKAVKPLAPKPPLEQFVDLLGPNPFGQGVWIAGGSGFQWTPPSNESEKEEARKKRRELRQLQIQALKVQFAKCEKHCLENGCKSESAVKKASCTSCLKCKKDIDLHKYSVKCEHDCDNEGCYSMADVKKPACAKCKKCRETIELQSTIAKCDTVCAMYKCPANAADSKNPKCVACSSCRDAVVLKATIDNCEKRCSKDGCQGVVGSAKSRCIGCWKCKESVAQKQCEQNCFENKCHTKADMQRAICGLCVKCKERISRQAKNIKK